MKTPLSLLLVFLAGATLLGAAEVEPGGQQTARLTALCRGPGTLRPDYNGKLLVLGQAYTMVAMPRAGYLFTNWTDGYERVVTNQPRLTFVMKSNAVFVAHFIRRNALPGLEGVSAGDLPLRVLGAVEAAPPGKQAEVLTNWFGAICAERSVVLPAAVATVIAAHPELLRLTVAAALASCPDETYGVVNRVARLPGASLSDLVAAAATASPTQCYAIAQAVLDADPTAGKIILRAIAATVPELSAAIGTAGEGSSSLSKNQTLDILTQALAGVHWPANGTPSSQDPWDYSTPTPRRTNAL